MFFEYKNQFDVEILKKKYEDFLKKTDFFELSLIHAN